MRGSHDTSKMDEKHRERMEAQLHRGQRKERGRHHRASQISLWPSGQPLLQTEQPRRPLLTSNVNMNSVPVAHRIMLTSMVSRLWQHITTPPSPSCQRQTIPWTLLLTTTLLSPNIPTTNSWRRGWAFCFDCPLFYFSHFRSNILSVDFLVFPSPF